MSKTIVFVHGMFLTSKSWDNWQSYFTDAGFDCLAPEWPFHGGEPAEIRRQVPTGLGSLSLDSVIAATRRAIGDHPDAVLIGHSVGGLIVQKLLCEGLGSHAVPICPVAPNRMLSLDWGFLRNSVSITNPLKGDEPYPMDADGFFQNFANTGSRADSDRAFERYAVPESRNVLRDCMGDTGKIDLALPHRPMLFVGAEKDEIIPAQLVEKNAKAYSDTSSKSDHVEFKNRGHYICGQPGWEEVAAYILTWLGTQGVAGHSFTRKRAV